MKKTLYKYTGEIRDILMVIEKLGLTFAKSAGKYFKAAGKSISETNIKMFNIRPSLSNTDIVQISRRNPCVSNNLTYMVDNISNEEFNQIDNLLIKAITLDDFKNISIKINRLPPPLGIY